MKTVRICLALLVVLIAYLALWPVPIAPQRWSPGLAPPADAYPDNDALRGIERLAVGVGDGPEGIALDAQGRIYAGYDDGRVMRFDGDGRHGELLAKTGGRPLGISVGSKGLFVADARRGLLQIGTDGQVRVLSTAADGIPFRFPDDVAQSDADPDVYFTDASARFGPDRLMADILEHGDSGRVLRYDPASGQTRTLMSGLHFANGIAFGCDGACLYVSETNEYRVWRYWLRGEHAGQQEIFVDRLPGFPDNLSVDTAGHVWIALYAPRDATLDAMASYPWLRKLAYRLPSFLLPKAVAHSGVVAFDADGTLVHNFQYAGDPSDPQAPPPYAPITSVIAYGPTLYFGSLTAPAIGRLPLPTETLRPAGSAP
ncbi:SMP-30/gluconolactonase/LRE family protein [Solimonas marina]|uniref:Strictosidine synthase family protein n=1 Tax=Solimonas marina TaxID=2714601 RepID=A0A970B5X1_9GAMM|nr:SMP-30/gluconolactonase/LRE family protein [Solimonas marina]NKF23842.1 strictosidine synthase family protein [Solimonas marina]